ncbi:hypothetical protein WMY93_023451 [Mugilogobius chulae]|uniref:Uncharacterized protein n=1 Tax=Mugilogobius chulae TaxID=88201 RepID=A0AAW0NET5_9GOBI
MAPKRHYKEYLLNESSQPSKATKCRRLANEKENTLNCRGKYKKYLSASCTTNNREVLKKIPLSNNGQRTYSLEEYPGDTPTTNKQNIPMRALLQKEQAPVGEGVSRKTHSVLELPPSPYSHCTSQFCGDRQDMQIRPEAQDMLEKQPGCNVPATPPDQQETPNQQVETFLLDGDDPAYPGAPLTKGQSLILLMSYVLRHNVTGSFILCNTSNKRESSVSLRITPEGTAALNPSDGTRHSSRLQELC